MQSDTIPLKSVTIKKYFEGEPNTAVEKVFNSYGKISAETQLTYDVDLKEFVPSATIVHKYGPTGVVETTTTKKGKNVVTEEYLYQFDSFGNWVKQIVTPANTYKTRKIKYYATSEIVKEEE